MNLKLAHTELSLRFIQENDLGVLFRIYASTRTEELAQTDWSEEQKRNFLQLQFNAQHQHYQNNYQGADFWLIYKNVNVVGRLYLHRNYQNAGYRIIDISLLPEYRNIGIGTTVLKEILAAGKTEKKPVTIHVESYNPAKKLYEKLGFRLKSTTNEVYHLMEYGVEADILETV